MTESDDRQDHSNATPPPHPPQHGPQGASGYPPPQGAPGYPGPQGAAGYAQPYGAPGYAGPQGSAGYGQHPGGAGYAQPAQANPPVVVQQRGGSILRKVLGILLLLSVGVNIYLAIILSSMFAPRFDEAVIVDGTEEQVVAVWDVIGLIDQDQADRFRAFCRKAIKDDNIQAVVVRVNSGGGGVGASDRMYKAILDVQQAGKKVVISMGTVAASGGYYIAAPADAIFAEQTTLTGSIGVLMYWFVVEGTLDKIGVEPVVLTSTDAAGWKDELSPLKQPEPYQLDHLRKVLDDMQARFEHVVRSGRGQRLSPRPSSYTVTVETDGATRQVERQETEPLNGKVYLAEEALELGLIDAIGYEDEAIDEAAELAGLDDPRVIRYSPRVGLMEALLEARSGAPALTLDPETIEQAQTPKFMMIWRVQK